MFYSWLVIRIAMVTEESSKILNPNRDPDSHAPFLKKKFHRNLFVTFEVIYHTAGQTKDNSKSITSFLQRR